MDVSTPLVGKTPPYKAIDLTTTHWYRCEQITTISLPDFNLYIGFCKEKRKSTKWMIKKDAGQEIKICSREFHCAIPLISPPNSLITATGGSKTQLFSNRWSFSGVNELNQSRLSVQTDHPFHVILSQRFKKAFSSQHVLVIYRSWGKQRRDNKKCWYYSSRERRGG